ncbi:MAG: Phosphoribosylaminoimidazole-succinocarboxamide synthase [Thermoplasmatales archaeon]|jgi:phosphoribosylaminoimidazole-succinocarboxamide synthase|nr:Phosphoribosylaminoimidazole-succinocarboxamide synthase [Thermoplasmatales archaeon]
MNAPIVIQTELPAKILNKGKVRDVYEINDNILLIATDRLSAFDVVLPDPIPSKGVCLTQLSKFWFDYTKKSIPNHVISTEITDFPKELHPYQAQLAYRSMLVKKTQVIPIECIVRGYLSGSAWNSYKKDGTVCGMKLPSGLKESDPFPEPLFTPSTKAKEGHDLNISIAEMKKIVGADVGDTLNEYSLKIYTTAVKYAKKRGIIIADTKFEFGVYKDEIIWIDEALTPDSSRFWPADSYQPGKPQPSFDKQYVRDYLNSTGWDHNTAPPRLPPQVIAETSKKYQEAYEKITGKKFHFP